MALPFEQQPKESAKAFAAFSLYLSLGPERSIAQVAAKLSKSEGLIGRWSGRFDWGSRVQAHAAYMAAVEREATDALTRGKSAEWVKRQEQLKEREWEMHEKALTLAREAIDRWLADEKRKGSLEGIARLLEVASKMGRMASGLATEHVEHTGEDGGPIRVEFEAALRKVYGPVVDAEVVPTAPKLIEEGA